MDEHGSLEPVEKIVTPEVIIVATLGGFMFALYIYLVFVALLYFSVFTTGIPEWLSIITSALAAGIFVSYRHVEKRSRLSMIAWIRWGLLMPGVFMAAAVIIALKINVTMTMIALFMMTIILGIGSIWVISSLCFPGFFTKPFQRGKTVSLTILAAFSILAGASGTSLLVPDLSYRAGLLFLGVVSIVVGLLSKKIGKSARMQHILAPPEVPAPPAENVPHDRDRRQYFIALFMFKACIGMLLRIFLHVAPEIISMDGIWFTISLVAMGAVPVIGVLTDRVGRKVFFALASGACAVMFGMLAFSGQGVGGQWSLAIMVSCLVLFGIGYPAILVSEFAIFHDLSDDGNRKQVVAGILCIHVTGVAAGLTIGMIFDTPNMAYFFLATNLLTICLLVTSSARETLPNKEELLWPKMLRHLYIYHSKTGTGLYDLSFENKPSIDDAVITGGLASITSLISEVTKRDSTLTSIQQQDATILFFSGRHVTAALVVEKPLDILRDKIKDIVIQFEDLFNMYLQNFVGEVQMFAPAEFLARKIFHFSKMNV
ncbi:MAG: hypothetical protein Q6373_006955 [Candidatus Sigynarchaeota archaeon]